MEIATQAEKILIGSIILRPSKLVYVADIIKPEDFICENAKKTYMIALALWRNKEPVDVVSIASQDKTLVSYIASAMSEGSEIGINQQAMRVSLNAKERRVKEELLSISNSEEPIDVRLDNVLRLYQNEMFINRKDPDIDKVIGRFDKRVLDNKKRGQLGVSTGFNFLEEKYIQYVPGHIWMMGAFTSVGKTAMMIQKLCNLISSENCPKIIVISTEMTEEQIVARILGNFSSIYSQRILSGKYYSGEEERVSKLRDLISKRPIKIYEDVYELSEIETVFRKADLQGGVDVGFIDYVQNCTVRGISKEYEEQTTLAKGFQKLAKAIRATLVCLSQVSNDVGRGNSDQLEYKGSGAWAAVADVGIMLKKKGYELRYLLDKNRHGPTHRHLFEYKANYTRLEPMEEL